MNEWQVSNPKLGNLLRLEREVPPPNTDSASRVWLRLENNLGLAPTPSTAPPRSPSPAPQSARWWLTGLRWMTIAAAAGGLWRAGLWLAARDRPHPLPSLQASANEPTMPAPSPASTEPPAVALASDAPTLSKGDVGAHESPGRAHGRRAQDATVDAERLILGEARRALGEQDYALAFAKLHEHRMRFANGNLAEERDALGIRVLVASGQLDKARIKLADFVRRHPASLFRTALEQSLDAPR